MDQPTIQARVNRGNAIAARFLGATFNQYRPASVSNPIAGAPRATLKAAFDADPQFSFKAPSGYGKAIYYGLFDGTGVAVGDYFTNTAQGVFFAAGYEPVKPWLCVQCNRTITITRPNPVSAVGLSPTYGGRTAATETPLLTAWPASVLQGTKGEQAPASGRLPADVRLPAWLILLPAYPGVILHSADRITDEIGRAYTISSAEQSSLGWRVTAVQSET